MLLMEWDFQASSSSTDDELQSKFYFKSGNYWNNNWNSTESKYMIPFEKHPFTDAQVRFLFLFNFEKNI